jgi:hypothetical protein
MTRPNRIFLGLLLLSSGLWTACAPKKIEYPGYIYVLANSTIYEISREAAAIFHTGIKGAAFSPDGEALLMTEEAGTSLVNLKTGQENKLTEKPIRGLGWNTTGSRFFIISDPDPNQLSVGDRTGKMRAIFRGPRLTPPAAAGAAEAGAAAPNPIAGEISGGLFLDPITLIFSAYEGVIAPSIENLDVSANRAYLVDVSAEEPDFQFKNYLSDERWTFVDVDKRTGAVLAVNGKKSTGEFLPYLSLSFRKWDDFAVQSPIPGSLLRSANGDYSFKFQPGSGMVGGIAAVPDKKAFRARFFLYDPDSSQSRPGPDLGWGDDIIGPFFFADGSFAAALLYTSAKQWSLKIIDLTSQTASTVWTLPAPEKGTPPPTDKILAWRR